MEASLARNILHINASARREESISRSLSQAVVDKISTVDTNVVTRDLGASPLPIVTEAWVGANFTPDEDRSTEQREALALSDSLIAELEAEIALYRAGLWQAPERKGGKKSEKPERKTDAEPGK